MLPVDDIRKKLLTQRRNLFRQAAQTEEELLWFETRCRKRSGGAGARGEHGSAA